MKKKRRYLALRVYGDIDFNGNDLLNSILRVIKETFGELGLSEMEVYLIKWVKHKNIGIFRCNTDQIDKLRFVTIFIRQIKGNPISVSVIQVSSTIKDLKEKFLA